MARALLPIGIWSLHFTLLYGLTALACARQWDIALPWLLGAAALAAMLALGALARPAYRRASGAAQLEDVLALGLGALAAIAIAWETSSVFWVRPCA